MNIPISTQKVAVYEKSQVNGLVIKIQAITKSGEYPPVRLLKGNEQLNKII